MKKSLKKVPLLGVHSEWCLKVDKKCLLLRQVQPISPAFLQSASFLHLTGLPSLFDLLLPVTSKTKTARTRKKKCTLIFFDAKISLVLKETCILLSVEKREDLRL